MKSYIKLTNIVLGILAVLLFQNCSKRNFKSVDELSEQPQKKEQSTELTQKSDLLSGQSELAASHKSACNPLNGLSPEWKPYNTEFTLFDLARDPVSTIEYNISSVSRDGRPHLYPPTPQAAMTEGIELNRSQGNYPTITISGSVILPSTDKNIYDIYIWGYDEKCKFRVAHFYVQPDQTIVDENNTITNQSAFPTFSKALSEVDVSKPSLAEFSSIFYSVYRDTSIKVNNLGPFYSTLNRKFYKLAVGRELKGGDLYHIQSLLSF